MGLALFVAGFAALGFEVFWIRALSYLIGNSTYALSAVLSAVLLGIGGGGLVLPWVVRRGNPEKHLVLCHIAIAVLGLGAMLLTWLVWAHPGLYDQLNIHAAAVRERPWGLRLLVDAALVLATLLPASLCIGLAFPLTTRLFWVAWPILGAGSGRAYLFASAGNVLGGLASGLVLLPLLGTLGGTKLVALTHLGLGAGLALFLRGRQLWLVWGGAAIGIVGLCLLLPASMPLKAEGAATPEKVIFQVEADIATVQVLEAVDDESRRSMAIDGSKLVGGIGFRDDRWYRKQVVLAHLPMVLDPSLERALNIGLGTGATLGALASYPWLKKLDCVEINGGVVAASAFFEESAALDDERVQLVVDDALHFLLSTNQRYDLIVSDGKQDPFFAGNAALLSREFYRAARQRLSPKGLFVQWIPLGILYADLQVVLRTISQAFPQVNLFYFPRGDLVLVASIEALAGRTRLDEETYFGLPVHRSMQRYNVDKPGVLIAHWTAERDQLLQVLGAGPINTWDRLILEYSAFKAPAEALRRSERENLNFLLEAEGRPLGKERGPGKIGAAERQAAAFVRRAFAAYFSGQYSKARALADRAVQARPRDQTARGTAQFMRQAAAEKRN